MFIVGILLSAGICAKFSSYKITSVFACGVISSMLSSGPLCSLLSLWSVRSMLVNGAFEEKNQEANRAYSELSFKSCCRFFV